MEHGHDSESYHRRPFLPRSGGFDGCDASHRLPDSAHRELISSRCCWPGLRATRDLGGSLSVDDVSRESLAPGMALSWPRVPTQPGDPTLSWPRMTPRRGSEGSAKSPAAATPPPRASGCRHSRRDPHSVSRGTNRLPYGGASVVARSGGPPYTAADVAAVVAVERDPLTHEPGHQPRIDRHEPHTRRGRRGGGGIV